MRPSTQIEEAESDEYNRELVSNELMMQRTGLINEKETRTSVSSLN